MKGQPNSGKALTRRFADNTYWRFPIKTHPLTAKDTLSAVIKKYVAPFLEKNDTVVISERVIAIMEGRSYPISAIHPSWWAQTLHKFVYKHPGGIGLRSPYTMELAIGEVGLWRIIFAAIISVITKPFGVRGMFYRVAGGNINAIDGPTSYSLPPSDKSAKLPPKNPAKTAQIVADEFNIAAVVIDANDYGVRVMGYSRGVDKNLIEKIFADNPMGQGREQTPIVIVRKKLP